MISIKTIFLVNNKILVVTVLLIAILNYREFNLIMGTLNANDNIIEIILLDD